MPISNLKLSKAGRLIELYTFEKPIPYDFETEGANRGKRRAAKAGEKFDPKTMDAARRAKAKLRRLCFANAWEWPAANGNVYPPMFNTYTFRDNVTDPKEAHAEFTKGMERMNYQWRDLVPGGLKYVVVPERQKRGAIHYHQIVFNQPYIPHLKEWVAEIWKHGYVFLKCANSSKMLFSYIGKYLAKDLASGREFNGKRYFASRGLKQPEIIRRESHIKMVLDAIPQEVVFWEPPEPVQTEKAGKIYYRRYLLPESLEMVSVSEMVGAANSKNDVAGDIVPVPTDAPDEPRLPVTPFNN